MRSRIHSDSVSTNYQVVPEVPGYGTSDRYLVGDDGSLWTKGRRAITLIHEKIEYAQLKGSIRPDGYRHYALSMSSRRFQVLGHRLVLLVFRGPCPEGMEGRHLNGIRDDNRLENLEYSTHLVNIHDKFLHGTIHRGEQIVQSKLLEIDIRRIRSLADYGVPKKVLGEIFGIGHVQVGRICFGERWAHVD